jgi:hypothetical protein
VSYTRAVNVSEFEIFLHRFERRVELIGGRVLVSHTPLGSKVLLELLLKSWGVKSILSLAEPSVFWEALKQTYAVDRSADLENLQTHTTDVDASTSYDKKPTKAPKLWRHNELRQKLMMDLFAARPAGAHVYHRDIVMRLGDDAPTPDIFIATPLLNSPMSDYYLDGPADVVIEVEIDRSENESFEERLSRYLDLGVREVWCLKVDPDEFIVYDNDTPPSTPSVSGKFSSQAVPGLTVDLAKLFGDRDESCVVWEKTWQASESPAGEGISYGDLPFTPRLRLGPAAIGFDEFIAWCPESKLELSDGKVVASGVEGTRNLIGLLGMTLGTLEVVKLAPVDQWIEGLVTNNKTIHEANRQRMMKKARAFADEVKQRLNLNHVFLTSETVNKEPWDFWSQVQLVLPEIDRRKMMDAYTIFSKHFAWFEGTVFCADDVTRHPDLLIDARELD